VNDRPADAIARQRNWGRWGDEDELGAANLLTPDRVRQAATHIRTGRIFSLALPLGDRDVPVLPGRTPPQHFMRRDGGDYAAGLKRKGGFQTVDDVVILPTHGATHIDALAHVADEDKLYNGFPLSSVRSNGAAHCGIDKLPGLVGRGVLLDLCAARGEEALPGGSVVTPEDLESCERRQSVTVGPGDIVLLRTGWLSVFAGQGATAFFREEPGIGLAAAGWLAERDVAAVGADNYGVEVIPTEDGRPGPVHRALVRDCGIYLLELLVLDPLAEAGVSEFLFVAAPLPIAGGVGSPINPLAIA
jgi:kynurenine formamidase